MLHKRNRRKCSINLCNQAERCNRKRAIIELTILKGIRCTSLAGNDSHVVTDKDLCGRLP
jgi:hypothetical protein